jgi:cytoskeletal protein RodZ
MSISELGAYLQRHREERGLTLEDVEQVTRIRKGYLVALEAGNWDALPPGVYTRGLLKMYARSLGVKPNGVLRMYVKERPSEARLPEPQLISRPLVTEPRVSFETLYSAAVLVLAAALFGWMIVTQLWPRIEASRQPPPAATAAAVAAAVAAGQPSPTAEPGGLTVSQQRDTRPTQPPQIRPTARNVVAAVSPTPGASLTPTPSTGLQLQVAAEAEDIWIIVRSDGTEVYNNFVRAGDSMRFSAERQIYFKTGRTRATRVDLNGNDVGQLPTTDGASELEWTRAEDGKIVQTDLRDAGGNEG